MRFRSCRATSPAATRSNGWSSTTAPTTPPRRWRQRLGVDHVVRHPVNRGLAAAFMTGLDAALARGADIIVNTDADNQYDARDIETLVRPIIERRAEMVIGARPIADTEHFSWLKKKLQGLGSARRARWRATPSVADAPSGFRAFTREAAQRLNVFSSYTYTLETIIQAGHSNIRVLSVPIRTNPDLRPSRLVKSIGRYVWRSASTIVRIFATYRPLTFFWLIAAFFLALGGVLGRLVSRPHAAGAGRRPRAIGRCWRPPRSPSA